MASRASSRNEPEGLVGGTAEDFHHDAPVELPEGTSVPFTVDATETAYQHLSLVPHPPHVCDLHGLRLQMTGLVFRSGSVQQV
jgi:hypothetical protein